MTISASFRSTRFAWLAATTAALLVAGPASWADATIDKSTAASPTGSVEVSNVAGQ